MRAVGASTAADTSITVGCPNRLSGTIPVPLQAADDALGANVVGSRRSVLGLRCRPAIAAHFRHRAAWLCIDSGNPPQGGERLKQRSERAFTQTRRSGDSPTGSALVHAPWPRARHSQSSLPRLDLQLSFARWRDLSARTARRGAGGGSGTEPAAIGLAEACAGALASCMPAEE